MYASAVCICAAVSSSTTPVPAVTRPKKRAVAMFAILASVTVEFGISAVTIARNVGVAAPPDVGPENMVFAVCVASDPVSVPDVVTGEPDTLKIAGSDKATLVTVPDPPEGAALAHVVPFHVNTWPVLVPL